MKKNELVTLEQSNANFEQTNLKANSIQHISNQIVSLIMELVDEREANNLSQRDLAENMGIKQPALARFERIDVIPRLDTFLRLANALNFEIALKKIEVIANVSDTQSYFNSRVDDLPTYVARDCLA